jgi:hypothetical protein
MHSLNYYRGSVAAFTLFKVAYTVGLATLSAAGGIGAKPGVPKDQDPLRRKSTIDRAFLTNETLPSATSTTDEAPMRSP